VTSLDTTRGSIKAKKIGLAVAGNTSRVASLAGLRLPIESHVLQAFVSEGIKPAIDCVVTFGAGHFYLSQSDKGGLVFGGDIDGYNSYAWRGNMPIVEDVLEEGMAIWPGLGRIRMLRQWGGLMDMSMDGSPIIDRTSVEGLYLNAGWCYGGFKATPASGWCVARVPRLCLPARQSGRPPSRALVSRRRLPQLARGDAQHAHARDQRREARRRRPAVSGAHRLSTGGLIDRAQPLSFTFDEKPY